MRAFPMGLVSRFAPAVLVAVICGWPPVASAAGRQTGDRSAAPIVSEPQAALPDDLHRVVAEQQRLIEMQSRRLDAMERALQQTRMEVTSLAARQGAPLPEATEQRLGAIDDQSQRQPEMPTDVSAEFPGSIPVPGTRAAIKIGGQVRLSSVHTLDPLGTDDRFVTSSIPVGEQRPPGEESRVVYTAIPSRFGFDVRTPFGASRTLRTFVEGDFAGSSRTFRLRHAFIQSNRFLVGQSWSTFSDPEAEPTGVDFEGLNAISLFRQAQVRYTHSVRDGLAMAVALENPAPDLSGAQGVNHTPDVIGRLRWEPGGSGLFRRTEHVQAAILVRQLRGQVDGASSTTVTTGAVGVNVSGVLVPRWDDHDRVKFASNVGWGIGKYITDLGTLGGQDAVYDPATGTLEALRVDSAYIGYERTWRPGLLSAFTYGVVNVHNLAVQPADAFQRTQRATFNITWSPVPQGDLGLEFLTGTRVNKDGRSGAANQIQAGWTYRF